jgi:purine-nucleoside phosphorylase
MISPRTTMFNAVMRVLIGTSSNCDIHINWTDVNIAVAASTDENPQVIMISPRTTMFNAVTWCMVDLHGNNTPKEGVTCGLILCPLHLFLAVDDRTQIEQQNG